MALEAAARAVAEALNQPGATQTRLIELLEQHTSFTVRSPQQEAALRGLVRLADVAADQGIAETVRLDDAPMWLHAKFLERRKAARVQLKSAELCEFLADAYANLCSLGDQRGECQAVRIPEAAPDNSGQWAPPSSLLGRATSRTRQSRTCSMQWTCSGCAPNITEGTPSSAS